MLLLGPKSDKRKLKKQSHKCRTASTVPLLIVCNYSPILFTI